MKYYNLPRLYAICVFSSPCSHWWDLIQAIAEAEEKKKKAKEMAAARKSRVTWPILADEWLTNGQVLSGNDVNGNLSDNLILIQVLSFIHV